MFLSIFAATCRPHNITAFLDNLAQTADDPNSFEVLLKLDEGANELINILENYKKTSPLNIKYLATEKLEGYYSLDVGYNELLKIAHPDTYFCWLLTDEIRLKTQGWDSILKKYIKFYPDDIFRIKLSIFQSKNYTDFFECLPCPDNYAVTTRKWLEITGGWGNFWGPDSWHQCIDFFLYLCRNQYNEFGIWRSFPIFDIKVGGQEAGQGIVDPAVLHERTRRIWQGWQKHSTHAAQENFYRLAQRLNAHIYACEKNIPQYCIRENLKQKTVSLLDKDSNLMNQKWEYKLPRFKITIFIGRKQGTFFQFFPFAFKYKSQLNFYYKLCCKIYNFSTNKFYKITKQALQDTAEFVYRIIYSCLMLPNTFCRFMYRKIIKPIVPMPKKLVELLNKLLLSPVKLYQYIATKMGKFIRIAIEIPHGFKIYSVDKFYSNFKRKTKDKNIYTYFFDGKNLNELEEPSLITIKANSHAKSS